MEREIIDRETCKHRYRRVFNNDEINGDDYNTYFCSLGPGGYCIEGGYCMLDYMLNKRPWNYNCSSCNYSKERKIFVCDKTDKECLKEFCPSQQGR